MISILQVFYSVFSGLLLSLAIPNEYYLHGVPFLAFIAIIPLYKAIKSAGSYRRAFFLGFIQTITTHLASSFWLAFFKDFAIFTLGGSALASGLYGGVTALAMYMPYYNQNKERLYQYSKLLRKHNCSIEELVNKQNEFKEKLKFFENKDYGLSAVRG